MSSDPVSPFDINFHNSTPVPGIDEAKRRAVYELLNRGIPLTIQGLTVHLMQVWSQLKNIMEANPDQREIVRNQAALALIRAAHPPVENGVWKICQHCSSLNLNWREKCIYCRNTFPPAEPLPQPGRRDGLPPCGECHLNPGETCNICGATRPAQDTPEAANAWGDKIRAEGLAGGSLATCKSCGKTFAIAVGHDCTGLGQPK